MGFHFNLAPVLALLEHATYGLSALKTLIGAKNATATADDLSDIATTDLSAKLGRALLRFSADAFSSSIDGSARTDIETIYTALGVLLGTRAATAHVTFPSSTASALAYLKGQQIAQGLCYYADITGYTDTTRFASTTLAGFETHFFKGWYCFLIRDASGVTPQGARSLVTAFTTSTGAIVLASALPSAGAIGDQIMLVHPVLMDAWNMRGGVEGIQDIIENQNAELDTARGKYTKTMTGGEDDLYGESSDTEFSLQEFRADLHNMDTGDVIVFRVYTTEDGTARKISVDTALTFSDAQDPARVEIIGSANQVCGREDISVTAEQTGTGTLREITCYWRDAKRGS